MIRVHELLNVNQYKDASMNKAFPPAIVTAFTCALFFMLFISGCAVMDNYGRLSMQQKGDRVTPEDLAQAWDRFNVYYTGYSVENPSAIVFDPKGDERTLHMHRWWTPVKDEKTLRVVMKWLGLRKEYDPVVYRILGPKGDFYGYMYTAWTHVTIKVVSDHTLWVDELRTPPDYAPSTWDVSVSRWDQGVPQKGD
jgi:hypothetical protein